MVPGALWDEGRINRPVKEVNPRGRESELKTMEINEARVESNIKQHLLKWYELMAPLRSMKKQELVTDFLQV